MRLRELAVTLNGELKGKPDLDISGAAGIFDAKKGDVTFLSDKKLKQDCADSKASCVIVRDFIPELDKPQIKVNNPLYAFAKALEVFYVEPYKTAGISKEAFVSKKTKIGADVTIHPLSYISDNADIGDNTVIFPGVFIGNETVIGSECILYPNVTVREKVRIGNRVIIHSGTVIGSDGFGYVLEGGKHYKIPQVGGVIIGDDVEIGANVTIDRATTGNTVIGAGTKIDNLVQVAHNVRIGENSIIVAQTGIAGSTNIGSYVVLGGQVGIADHASIEDGCMVGSQSGVFGTLQKGVYSGSPAIPHRDWLRSTSIFARLPELMKKIRELEDRLNTAEGRHKS